MRIREYHRAEIKSSLQKVIRRGMTEEAVSIAAAYIELDLEGICKRLPIIAVEDVGYEYLADTTYACRRAMGIEVEDAKRVLLPVVKRLAEAPKDKTTGWLACAFGYEMMKQGKKKDDIDLSDWVNLFTAALVRNDEYEAVKYGDMATRKFGYKPVLDILQTEACKRGLEAMRTADAAYWRIKQTARGGDVEMLINGVIMSICRSPVTEEIKPVWDGPLHAWTMDKHTYFGKITLGKVAREYGASKDKLGTLQFLTDSIKTAPVDKDEKYRNEAIWYMLRKHEMVRPDATEDQWIPEAESEWREFYPHFAEALNKYKEVQA